MKNSPGTYEVKIDFLGDLPEKLNLPREKVAEMIADELMKAIGLSNTNPVEIGR